MREAVRNRHRTHPSDRTVPQGRLHLPSSCNPGDPETSLWLVLNVDGDGTGIAFALLARVVGSAVESSARSARERLPARFRPSCQKGTAQCTRRQSAWVSAAACRDGRFGGGMSPAHGGLLARKSDVHSGPTKDTALPSAPGSRSQLPDPDPRSRRLSLDCGVCLGETLI